MLLVMWHRRQLKAQRGRKHPLADSRGQLPHFAIALRGLSLHLLELFHDQDGLSDKDMAMKSA
jgi:hypothetical protein